MAYCLVYVSGAAEKFTPQSLEELLAQCRERNAADSLTGLLLYHDGNFLQTLEGEKDKVEACFARIEKDPRHTGCILLHAAEIEARSFADWNMAYVAFDQLDERGRRGFRDLLELSAAGNAGQLTQDPAVNIFVRTFLSGFSDL